MLVGYCMFENGVYCCVCDLVLVSLVLGFFLAWFCCCIWVCHMMCFCKLVNLGLDSFLFS